MVLGLGSRSKKDRASAASPSSSSASQDFDLAIQLHEIKPWHGIRSSKTPSPLMLRWSRGGKPVGSSRSVGPKLGTPSEGGTIVFDETLRIAASLFNQSKKTKKPSVDSDMVLLFTLVDSNTPKGQPLAQTGLNLVAFSSMQGAKSIQIPLTLSKKVSSKGAISYLHLTVERRKDDRSSTSGAAISVPPSSANSASSRNSDASTAPPLDEETQQSLVAALLSDEENEEVASFTDEDMSQGSSASLEMEGTQVSNTKAPKEGSKVLNPKELQANNGSVNLTAPEPAEKRLETTDASLSRPAISSPQVLPVKAAAIAAAAAYVPKRSFFSRNSNSMTTAASYDSFSDPDSLEDDDISPPKLGGSGSPSLPVKNPVMPSPIPDHVSYNTASKDAKAKSGDHKNVLNAAVEKERVSKILERGNLKNSFGDSKQSPQAIPQSMSKSSFVSSVAVDAVNHVTGMNISLEIESQKSPIVARKEVPSSNLTVESSGRLFETYQEERLVVHKDLERGKKDLEIDKTPEKLLSKPDHKMETVAPKLGAKVEQQKVMDDAYERKSVLDARPKPAAKSPTKDGGLKYRTSMSPDQRGGKTEKQVAEAANAKVASAESAAAAAETRLHLLEAEVEKLKGELRDVASVEAALYSTTAEHGSSSLKIHAPARRLARMYVYASKHGSQESRASCAKNAVGSLVLVARACGNDVPRLTFWWSNAAVLRETISMAFNIPPSSSSELHHCRQNIVASSVSGSIDWRESSAFAAALERLEAWIYAKVVESIWWQILTLQMQKAANPTLFVSDQVEDVQDEKRETLKVFGADFEDGIQKNNAIEIWKKAFSEAYDRLCPVRGIGVECGCLPVLSKMVLQECVVRLDVAMFNAILRDDEAPTDPVSDPISDPGVLPISTSSLSFGQGAQLKNAVATLSSWVSSLLTKDAAEGVNGSIPEDDEKSWIIFPMLKAMGGLLMLPKDMLIDKSLRKEVCPMLSLPLIGRILSKFKPDEFSPEPVTPELLDTINSEIAAESQGQLYMVEDASFFRIATVPSVKYSAPQSMLVRRWIGEPTSQARFNRSKSSVLRKGHTSDDEIDELESPIPWLLENTTGLVVGGHEDNYHSNGNIHSKEEAGNCRFRLLREVWKTA